MLPALPTGMKRCVRRIAESVDDLERRRLLALDAVRVDGVDQRDGVLRAVLARQAQGVVEVAVNRDDLGAVSDALRQLAGRDAAARAGRRSTRARSDAA